MFVEAKVEWFNITWIFVIITFACAFFFFQELSVYNNERAKIMPQLRKICEIRKRYQAEIDKVDELYKEAEQVMSELSSELEQLKTEAMKFEVKVEASRKYSEAER